MELAQPRDSSFDPSLLCAATLPTEGQMPRNLPTLETFLSIPHTYMAILVERRQEQST